MKIRVSDAALDAIAHALAALGVRHIRSGSLTLHFDATGRFAGWRESQDREVVRDGAVGVAAPPPADA